MHNYFEIPHNVIGFDEPTKESYDQNACLTRRAAKKCA